MSNDANEASSPTVSTAEEDYRGYQLQAVRVFSNWQCSIYAMREGLPPPVLGSIIAAATLSEVFDKARRRVDHMLDRR